MEPNTYLEKIGKLPPDERINKDEVLDTFELSKDQLFYLRKKTGIGFMILGKVVYTRREVAKALNLDVKWADTPGMFALNPATVLPHAPGLSFTPPPERHDVILGDTRVESRTQLPPYSPSRAQAPLLSDDTADRVRSLRKAIAILEDEIDHLRGVV